MHMYNEYVASTGVKDWRRTMLDEELHTSYMKQLHLPKDMDNLFESDAKEFQKMMAWKRTVFVFSLRFCAFFAAMSKEKVPEKRRKTPDFSAFLCRKKQAITRKHPCFCTLRHKPVAE